MEKRWHMLTSDEALEALSVSPSGLNNEDAAKRLEEYGPNELSGKGGRSWLLILLNQFLNPLVYILLAASVVSSSSGGSLDAFVIWGIIIIMVAIGFIQEVRAKMPWRL